MRKTILLLGAMLAALVVVSGVAWAANIQCPNDPRGIGGGTCWGTAEADVIIGSSKHDDISSDYGADLVRARAGADFISNGESDY